MLVETAKYNLLIFLSFYILLTVGNSLFFIDIGKAFMYLQFEKSTRLSSIITQYTGINTHPILSPFEKYCLFSAQVLFFFQQVCTV